MTIEGVDWNKDHFVKKISEGLSLSQFIDEGLKDGHYKKFSLNDRKTLLKMAYDRLKSS